MSSSTATRSSQSGMKGFTVKKNTDNVCQPHQLKIVIKKSSGDRLGLGCTLTTANDIRISSLANAAERNGNLKIGDVVDEINGMKISTLDDVSKAMKKYKNDNDLTLTITRGKIYASRKADALNKHMTDVQLEAKEGKDHGVLVDKNLVVQKVKVGSPADGKFKVGDKVVACGGWPLGSSKEFYAKLHTANGNFTIKVERTGDANQNVPSASAQSSDNDPDHKLKTLDVKLVANEPIGIVPDEALKIVRVQVDSAAARAHFKVGDIIKKVNDKEPLDLNNFHDLLDELTPASGSDPRVIKVLVDRSESREVDLEVHRLPDHYEKMVSRHPGFEYLVVNVSPDPNEERRYGLNLANCKHNQVIVTGCKKNTVAGDYFQVYDRIIAINSTPVTDENVAKEYICALNGTFEAVVERPSTREKQEAVEKTYNSWLKEVAAKKNQAKPEDFLPVDAMAIAQDYNERRKQKMKIANAILRAKPLDPVKGGLRLTFSQNLLTVTEIVSDVPEGKRLRKC